MGRRKANSRLCSTYRESDTSHAERAPLPLCAATTARRGRQRARQQRSERAKNAHCPYGGNHRQSTGARGPAGAAAPGARDPQRHENGAHHCRALRRESAPGTLSRGRRRERRRGYHRNGIRERISSMQIGFIGIGVMGRPMTLNLLKAEHHVTIYARHPQKPEVQEVLNAGAKLAPSPRAVAIASEMVITMVPNSAQVEEVVAGPQGILEGARKDLIIIDMSTIAPATSRKLAEAAAAQGVHFLDAPVSGGSQGAVNGTLTIMVGGDKEILERARPVLEAMGKKE